MTLVRNVNEAVNETNCNLFSFEFLAKRLLLLVLYDFRTDINFLKYRFGAVEL